MADSRCASAHQKPKSSPAECPEDALICVRRVGIVGESSLILIRSRENRQQVGKLRKVSILDRCVERLLHTMIARDEGWIDVSHRLSACVGLDPIDGQTRSPPRGPTVVGAGVGEQDMSPLSLISFMAPAGRRVCRAAGGALARSRRRARSPRRSRPVPGP